MTDVNKTATTTNLNDIPRYAITPSDWAAEALRRANEYLGMPEGAMFLVEARRYMAMDKLIKDLEKELAELRQEVDTDRGILLKTLF